MERNRFQNYSRRNIGRTRFPFLVQHLLFYKPGEKASGYRGYGYKQIARTVLGASLGLAQYVEPWSSPENASKTTDLSLGFLGKHYTGRTKGYYLTGFNIFYQPSLRFSIGNRIETYESGYYDYETDEYIYESAEFEKAAPFDIGLKLGIGYTWPISPDKLNRVSVSIFGDGGLLERHTYGYKTGFFGMQLSFDIGQK